MRPSVSIVLGFGFQLTPLCMYTNVGDHRHTKFRLPQNSTWARPSETWTLPKSRSICIIKKRNNNRYLLYSAVCSCQNPFTREYRAPTESSTTSSLNYYTHLVRKLVRNGFLPSSDSRIWRTYSDWCVNGKLWQRELKSSTNCLMNVEANKRKIRRRLLVEIFALLGCQAAWIGS